MEYTDQTAYLSATSNLTTIDFTGLTGSYNSASGLTVAETGGNVNFEGYGSSGNYSLQVEDNSPDWGNGPFLAGPFDTTTNVSGIIVTLPTGVYAVGSNVMAAALAYANASDATTVNVQLSTGSTLYPVITISGFSSMAFVGFTSTTAITSISFFSPTTFDQPLIDNFDFGQTAGESSATPEAGTSLMCGSGLLIIVRFLRRRQSSPPAAA